MLKIGNIPDSPYGDEVVNSGSSGSVISGISNPYDNLNYKKTPWQQFLSRLGFRTEADAFQENMQLQQNEFNTQLELKKYDESYNSPTAQVARMKAAGLNPDISGGDGIDSGSAASLGEDPSTPMQTSGMAGTAGEVMDFANTIMGIFSTSLGLTQSIQGVTRNRLENSILSLQNEGAMAEFAKGIIPFVLPQSDELHPSAIDSESWQSIAMRNAQYFAGNLPKNMQQKFLNTISNFWESAGGESLSYDEFKKNIVSRFGFSVSDKSYQDEVGDVLEIISDELGQMNQKIMKQQKSTELSGLEAEQATSENTEEYMNALSGSQQAAAENAQNALTETNATAVQIMNESLGSIIKRLEDKSKEGGVKGGLSSVALALLSAFRLFVTSQGMPSISRAIRF